MKTCKNFKQEKPLEDYYKKSIKRVSTGEAIYWSTCRQCVIIKNKTPKVTQKAPSVMNYKDYLIKANMMEYHKKSLRFQV